jgi:hypothetical protein
LLASMLLWHLYCFRHPCGVAGILTVAGVTSIACIPVM